MSGPDSRNDRPPPGSPTGESELGTPKNLRLLLAGIMAALVIVAALLAPDPDETGPESSFTAYRADVMASTVQVTLPGETDPAAAEEVFEIFREVDARMSEWKESSPLAAVNRRAGERPVPVPEDLRALLRRSVEISEATGGAFDVTWAALWGVWDFRDPNPELPDPDLIQERTELVDYRRLEIDEEAGTVFLPEPGMKVGLGGIAKGWALDRAAEALSRRGISHFLLQSGGQVLARGRRGDRAWRVGIRDPRGGPEDYFTTVELEDASLSTSGDYESYFVLDGVRYHHILDPRTGRPARHLRSATVLSDSATLADALSTALMAMPPHQGLSAATELGAEALVIDTRGEVYVTDGMRERLDGE